MPIASRATVEPFRRRRSTPIELPSLTSILKNRDKDQVDDQDQRKAINGKSLLSVTLSAEGACGFFIFTPASLAYGVFVTSPVNSATSRVRVTRDAVAVAALPPIQRKINACLPSSARKAPAFDLSLVPTSIHESVHPG